MLGINERLPQIKEIKYFATFAVPMLLLMFYRNLFLNINGKNEEKKRKENEKKTNKERKKQETKKLIEYLFLINRMVDGDHYLHNSLCVADPVLSCADDALVLRTPIRQIEGFVDQERRVVLPQAGQWRRTCARDVQEVCHPVGG